MDSVSAFRPLPSAFPSREAFVKAIPAMIIEHNIHGVDIDPRAVQIAGLSLWLRAQKTWQQAKVPAQDRPQIMRSNVVCAEPMPGNLEQLQSFCQSLNQPAIAGLVEHIFEKMQLAGEAGTLLKIEKEITELVATAKKDWLKAPKLKQAELFQADKLIAPSKQDQSELGLDFSGVTDEAFWDKAEERIYAALREYAESAEAVDYQRRLFAEDAAHGFAFIDLCRKRYDTVLMNPPFGDASNNIHNYLGSSYPEWNRNVLCAFLFRSLNKITQKGKIGAIFDRTAIIKSSYKSFRENIISTSNFYIENLLDLGWNVLDANVETTSMVLSGRGYAANGTFIDVRDTTPESKKTESLAKIAKKSPDVILDSKEFKFLPNCVFGYGIPKFLIKLFGASGSLKKSGFQALTGHSLPKEQYMRLWWESVNKSNRYAIFRGGAFFRYYASYRDICESKTRPEQLPNSQNTAIRNADRQPISGLGYGERGDFLNTYLLPSNMHFTFEGQGIPVEGYTEALKILAYTSTPLAIYIINQFCGQHKTPGYVNILPYPATWTEKCDIRGLDALLKKNLALRSLDETQVLFRIPTDFNKISIDYIDSRCIEVENLTQNQFDFFNDLSIQIAKVKESEISLIEKTKLQLRDPERPIEDFTQNIAGHALIVHQLYSSLPLGFCLGRWDIRYATGERQPPELPDPFDPLPVCPPGMLQGEDGLPLEKDELRGMNDEGSYPLRVTVDGILVDDANDPEDIVRRVREALRVIWGDRATAIEAEAIEILQGKGRTPKDLRDYFRTPGQFFASHLARYSKSRRKAPIYWPISTASGDYTLWLYYHRLDDQTLLRCVNRIKTKLESVSSERARLDQESNRSSAQDNELKKLRTFEEELLALQKSLETIAKYWKPNLNDGVQITAAPLWEHFRHKPWQKVLKDTWKKLEHGDYDWAHLAHSIWPGRVVPKCAQDRSLAIAHGHEERLWHQVEVEKGKKKQKALEWHPVPNADEVVAEILEELKAR